MGKYKTIEEALKGAGHLANMAKQAFTERDRALEQLSKVGELRTQPVTTTSGSSPVTMIAPAAAQVEAPSRESLDAAQARYDKVLSSIVDDGGVFNAENAKALSLAQRELGEAQADFKLREAEVRVKAQTTAEQNAWNEVDAYMAERHPNSAKFANEAALYLQSDPLLAAAVNALFKSGERIKATELAWTSFERVHGAQVNAEKLEADTKKEEDLAAREQVRKELVENARRDAGVVAGSAGGAGVHTNPNAGARSREEIDALTQRMRVEGDAPGSPAAVAFRRAVIGPSLDPAFFGPQ
jgi:hypothetical protein